MIFSKCTQFRSSQITSNLGQTVAIMGGYGSGRRQNRTKNTCIEECAILSTKVFSGQLGEHPSRGTVRWGDSSDAPATSANYSLLPVAVGKMVLALSYVVEVDGRVKFISDTFQLQATEPPFGGQRWWFCCPKCGRAVAKVFLPPGGMHFRCRSCQGLTYRSCQQSHTMRGFFNKLVRLGVFPICAETPGQS
jgi:hypothetical protein